VDGGVRGVFVLGSEGVIDHEVFVAGHPEIALHHDVAIGENCQAPVSAVQNKPSLCKQPLAGRAPGARIFAADSQHTLTAAVWTLPTGGHDPTARNEAVAP